MSRKKRKDKVNEPLLPYTSIRKSSFEDLENENRLYSLNLSPIERLAYLMELNLNAFGKQSADIELTEKKIYRH
jgi:hypothetical protein